MHKRSNEYKWFSRNNVDYTNTYGADPTTGSLSPFIHDLFHKNIERYEASNYGF